MIQTKEEQSEKSIVFIKIIAPDFQCEESKKGKKNKAKSKPNSNPNEPNVLKNSTVPQERDNAVLKSSSQCTSSSIVSNINVCDDKANNPVEMNIITKLSQIISKGDNKATKVNDYLNRMNSNQDLKNEKLVINVGSIKEVKI